MAQTGKIEGSQLLLAAGLLALASGCYAPLRAPAMGARQLPDSFRTPLRSQLTFRRNLATLSAPAAPYRLGTGDVLEVVVPRVAPQDPLTPLRVQVTEDGNVYLPEVGAVKVGAATLDEAHQRIIGAYADGVFVNPDVSVALAQKATIPVMVLGEVNQPGIHRLPRGENDIAHALAMAGGMTTDASDCVELHRGLPGASAGQLPNLLARPPGVASRRQPPAAVRRLGQVAAAPAGDAVVRVSGIDPHALPPLIGWPATPPPEAAPVPAAAPPADVASGAAPPRPAAPQRPLPVWRPGPQAPPAAPPAEQLPGPGPTRPAGLADKPSDNAAREIQPPPADLLVERPGPSVTCIPLRGLSLNPTTPALVTLGAGDVIVVPRKKDEVFYVVGPLNRVNQTRFGLDKEERQIGNGFLLPPDRDIDVITAVAMAGYIDPIESPTTVTVHRRLRDGKSLLVRVDLIEARYDERENLYVQSGDIIYLNPDPAWWVRRTFNNIVGQLILIPYTRLVNR